MAESEKIIAAPGPLRTSAPPEVPNLPTAIPASAQVSSTNNPNASIEKLSATVIDFVKQRYEHQLQVQANKIPGWEKRAGRSDEQLDLEQGIKFNRDLGQRLAQDGFPTPAITGNPTIDTPALYETLTKGGVLLYRVNGRSSSGDYVQRFDSFLAWSLTPETKTFDPPPIVLNGKELPRSGPFEYRQVHHQIVSAFPGMEGSLLGNGFFALTFPGTNGSYVVVNTPQINSRAAKLGLSSEEMLHNTLINEGAHVAAAKLPLKQIPHLRNLGTIAGVEANPIRIEEALSDLASIQQARSPQALAMTLRIQFGFERPNYQLSRAISFGTIQAFMASPYAPEDRAHSKPLLPAETVKEVETRNDLAPFLEVIKRSPAAAAEFHRRLESDFQHGVGEGFKLVDAYLKAREKGATNAR